MEIMNYEDLTKFEKKWIETHCFVHLKEIKDEGERNYIDDLMVKESFKCGLCQRKMLTKIDKCDVYREAPYVYICFLCAPSRVYCKVNKFSNF